MSIMLVVPRYSHHRHTGRLRGHHETSYGFLVILVLAVGVLLGGVTAADASTNGSGAYEVFAAVSGPRPSSPAIITSPTNGQVFQTNPITVTGTCPSKTMVKIYKNGVLAGSAICGPGNRFSLQMDLVIGANDLTALAYNALDQPGPDSPAVHVTLAQPPGGPGFSTELLIQSTNYYRGAQPGEEITWPVELVGGLAPYAVNFDWGDGTSDLITRTGPGPFTLKHTYKKVGGYLGTYPLIIRATDGAGHTAFLQLTTIINAMTGANGSSGKTAQSGMDKLMVIWPLWVILVVMVVSFWLGERREKHIMIRRMEAAGL